MRFVLDVELSDELEPDAVAFELGRILRYWGGSLKQVSVEPGSTQDIYDSEYRKVGSWSISGGQ